MKQLTLYLLLIVFSFCANGQSLVFIKGPIISNYLENGHPNKNFINIVDNFENDLYNGNCKIYEITFVVCNKIFFNSSLSVRVRFTRGSLNLFEHNPIIPIASFAHVGFG